MFANEGISDDLFKAFLIYLVSHPRPAHELLCPRRPDISAQSSDEFLGMTVADLSLDALLEARERLVREIHGSARQPANHQFLTSFHQLPPAWAVVEYGKSVWKGKSVSVRVDSG